MGKLLELRDKLHLLTPEALESEVLAIIKANEKVVINMNTDQLYEGKDSKGKKLPNYSARSVQVFGKTAGPMRLFDTGDFYRGFFVDASKWPVVVFSRDSKTGKIADLLASKGENPEDIYGLNQTNLKDFSRAYVLEGIGKYIRNFLGLR